MEMSNNGGRILHGVNALNYADEPSAGDYWSDMCVPILIVVRVDNMHVYYCQFTHTCSGYSSDSSNIVCVTREQFKNYLCYETEEKTPWAQVTPKVWEEWALAQDIVYKHET